MSYLVLARKWRPRDFDSLVGQDHVVRALTHALSTQRLHHAWLFTGTRGVGKTTLSRILAKSLNCETGITDKPCGQCQACTEIDAGRFVDYVELDAASNRGVDEMTQLLEQAVYAPSSGRFKVYMIDEVHMLTGHAFNAMLKTLEEPPPHVKFILATTDPQKIPPTVLSRCLQFNLKQMPPEAVADYLSMVLQQEQVPFEDPALRLIGRAASGSMRDALSLTDQAIAYSAGNLSVDAVRTMLGSVDQTHLAQLFKALVKADAQAIKGIADTLASRGISFRAALSDFAILLSQITIALHVPPDADDPQNPGEALMALARQMPPDLLQLFYTVAVHGREELVLAPDEYAGFMMVCLKMLSFVPAGLVHETETQPEAAEAEKKSLKSEAPSDQPSATDPEDQRPEPPPEDQAFLVEQPDGDVPLNDVDQDVPPWQDTPLAIVQTDSLEPVVVALDESLQQNWPAFATGLPLTGMAQQLATQSACLQASEGVLRLRVPTQALAQGAHVDRVKQVLAQHFQQPVKLELVVGELVEGTSAQHIADAQARQRQQRAEQIVQNDPFVNALIHDFGGQIVPGSVRPIDSTNPSVN